MTTEILYKRLAANRGDQNAILHKIIQEDAYDDDHEELERLEKEETEILQKLNAL